MKLAAVAFYGFALGLLAVGLRELLTGFEENRCSMTYMFEYPEYREGQVKYFLFALSSRRKAYGHFYCRSNNLEMTSWVYGCVHKSGPSCMPSVTEISGMLPYRSSEPYLRCPPSTPAPNCQYRYYRFCGPVVPVYTAVTLLLACGGQLSTILKSRRAAGMSQVVGKGLQPHKVNLPVYILHVLLSLVPPCLSAAFGQSGHLLPLCGCLPNLPDVAFHEGVVPVEEWPHLLSPLLYILGAAVASLRALLCLILTADLLILAPLHRPSVSRDCGTLRLRTQILIALCLTVIGGTSCGALSIFAAFLLTPLEDTKATDDREVSEPYAESGQDIGTHTCLGVLCKKVRTSSSISAYQHSSLPIMLRALTHPRSIA
ncbi:GPI inositol-deacylase [Lates japonicus]|uniref:GPI inositol-deacylase n=1 Tax=Lates japonicus TaxID=270547 RepID=A0AAD3MCJ7_LATJO|nr:GPI inositol-deacylase [Lates japonicus]